MSEGAFSGSTEGDITASPACRLPGSGEPAWGTGVARGRAAGQDRLVSRVLRGKAGLHPAGGLCGGPGRGRGYRRGRAHRGRDRPHRGNGDEEDPRVREAPGLFDFSFVENICGRVATFLFLFGIHFSWSVGAFRRLVFLEGKTLEFVV